MLTSLTLTLSAMPLTKANATDVGFGLNVETLREPNPAGFTCYSKLEMKSLATFKKNCDVCKLDLAETQKELENCVKGEHSSGHWYSEPGWQIAGLTVTFSIGILVGLALNK